MPEIIPLTTVPPAMVEPLLDRAFGTDRHGRTAYAIRAGMAWLEALSFAALDDERHLIGSLQCWPVQLTTPDGDIHPMIMVGPVAVDPDHQNQGYGRAMLGALIGAIAPKKPLPMMMIGDPDYYGPFGFLGSADRHWDAPGPVEQERVLVRHPLADMLPKRGVLGPFRARR